MAEFSDLILRYDGKPAVIMGGGPSLPDDLKKAPKDAVFFSVNQHGAMLRDVDYIVHIDAEITPIAKEFGVPVISRFREADYRLIEFPSFGNSAMLACWAAWMMGCAPVVICGVDCYAGGTYWHDEDAKSSGNNTSTDHHVIRWGNERKKKFPDAPVRVISGPLMNIFKVFKKNERIEYTKPEKPKTPEQEKEVDGTKVEILRGVRVAGEHYDPGQVVRLSNDMAYKIIKMGKGREYGG